MIGARSGQATAVSSTYGSAWRDRRARRRRWRRSPAWPAGRCGRCASPRRPAPRPGWTTPSTSTPSVVCIMPLAQRGQRGRGRRVAGDDEQLRAARQQLLGDLAARSARARPACAVAVREARGVGRGRRSPRAGSCTSSSCRTVSPPTPESKTAIGRARGSAGREATAAMVGGPAPRATAGTPRVSPSCAATPSIVDLIFSVTASAMPLPFTPPAASTTAANSAGDEQDQRDVLDRPLPRRARQPARAPAAPPRARGP